MLRSTFLNARRFRAFPLPATLLTTALAFAAAPVQAATYTWTGSGTNSIWATGSNWAGNAAPPTTGNHDLIFAGSTRTTNGPNTTYTLGSVSFSSGAAPFTITGQAGTRLININGSLTNNSTNLQTLGAATGNSLNINFGTNSARTIDAASGSLMILGSVQGSNVALSKTGTGTVTFGSSAGNNTLSGTVSVGAGAVDLQKSFSSATFDVASGASLNITTQAVNLVGISSSGAVVIDSPATLSGAFTMSGSSSTLDVNNSLTAASVALAGAVTVEGAVYTTGALSFAAGTETTFTLGNTTNGSINYAGPTAFAGDLIANITDIYEDANFVNPQIFPMFTESNSNGSTTSFDSITVNYDGQALTLAPSAGDPNIWVSAEFTNSISGQPQYVTFSNTSGELAVVPEPTGVVMAGLGVAMAGWQLARQRRSKAALRSSDRS